jgi:esterase/lipase
VISVPGGILNALAREYDVAANVGLTTKVKAQKSNAIVDGMMKVFESIEELNNIRPNLCLQIESQSIY